MGAHVSDEPFAYAAGDRVAQLILERIAHADVVPVDDLDDTARGAGGFGSTGVAAAAKAVLAAVRLSAMAKSSAAKRAAS